jgi:AcrR family transcriptional regulator
MNDLCNLHEPAAMAGARERSPRSPLKIQSRELGLRGFSPQNLWRMRQLYEAYRDQPELSTALRELTVTERSCGCNLHLNRLDGTVRWMIKRVNSVSSTRNRLLHAAAVVTAKDGYAALTLDSVASEAGISKGGLLYHFGSKVALVAAMVECLIADFERGHTDALSREIEGPGRWTRAYVKASLTGSGAGTDMTAGLVAAVALNPALLEPLRERYKHWIGRLQADQLDGVDAQIVRQAVDGLWLCSLLGLGVPSAAQQRRIAKRLLELAGESQ